MTNAMELIRSFKPDLARMDELFSLGRIREIEELIQKYHGLFPRDVAFLRIQGRVLYARHDFAAAERMLGKVLDLNPYHCEAAAFRAASLARLGRREEALTLLERTREGNEDDNITLEHYLPILLSERGLKPALDALAAEAVRRGAKNPPLSSTEVLRGKAISLHTYAEIVEADHHDVLGFKSTNAQRYNLKSMYESLEPIGCNCELGFVQRRRGAEPLSLLRWTAIDPPNLIALLKCDLDGYEDPDIYSLVGTFETEYLLKENRFGTSSHTGVNSSDIGEEEFLRRVVRRQGFLKKKFLEDARSGQKIFVYKSDVAMEAADIAAIGKELERLGVRRMLFVEKGAAQGERLTFVSDRCGRAALTTVMPDTQYEEWDKIIIAAHERMKN